MTIVRWLMVGVVVVAAGCSTKEPSPMHSLGTDDIVIEKVSSATANKQVAVKAGEIVFVFQGDQQRARIDVKKAGSVTVPLVQVDDGLGQPLYHGVCTAKDWSSKAQGGAQIACLVCSKVQAPLFEPCCPRN